MHRITGNPRLCVALGTWVALACGESALHTEDTLTVQRTTVS